MWLKNCTSHLKDCVANDWPDWRSYSPFRAQIATHCRSMLQVCRLIRLQELALPVLQTEISLRGIFV